MATVPLTLNPGRTALLMADFHREGMGDNPIVQNRGTVQTSRAVLEAARQAGMLVVYIVVNFRPGYPEISDHNLIFSERKMSGRVPPPDPVSLIILEVHPLPHASSIASMPSSERTSSSFCVRRRSTRWSCWGMRRAGSFYRPCAMPPTPIIA